MIRNEENEIRGNFPKCEDYPNCRLWTQCSRIGEVVKLQLEADFRFKEEIEPGKKFIIIKEHAKKYFREVCKGFTEYRCSLTAVEKNEDYYDKKGFAFEETNQRTQKFGMWKYEPVSNKNFKEFLENASEKGLLLKKGLVLERIIVEIYLTSQMDGINGGID